MAGAGQPWYMPLTWPVGHVTNALARPLEEDAPPKPKAVSELDLVGHLTSFAGATRSFLLACLCISHAPLHQLGRSVAGEGDVYPAFGAAETLSLAWILPIVLRNLLATWLICGFWDWFLYFSPLKERLAKFKINPKYPAWSQFTHDAFWTTISSLMGAAVEVACCYCWCNGYFPAFDRTLASNPLKNFLLAITITHWRVPHFWAIHRGMHPWRNSFADAIGFDLGKFLYKNVHALHHKSYNPTAWSGTSMHPVESTLYYSSCLLVVPLGCHPAVVLGCIIDCAVGAWLGHDGFQWPGSGDYFHQLHHLHFDCNYGAMHVPIDQWLGTFVGEKAGLQAVWKEKAVETGSEANETVVHEQGTDAVGTPSGGKGVGKPREAEEAGAGVGGGGVAPNDDAVVDGLRQRAGR